MKDSITGNHPLSCFSSIFSGQNNQIIDNANYCTAYSFIGQGGGNAVEGGDWMSIHNGTGNYILDVHYATIGNGRLNSILHSTRSVIVMGERNRITSNDAQNSYGFIGNGDCNCIDSFAGGSGQCFYNAIINGWCNSIAETEYGFIGSGCMNSIRNSYSGILGGGDNVVNGSFSSVLGGRNNTVNHNCAAVFGNGITSVANGFFHINNLYLNPATYQVFAGVTPPAFFPVGTVYADSCAGFLLRVQV